MHAASRPSTVDISGTSCSWLDYVIGHQLGVLRPRHVVDFGAGGGKIGRLVREHAGSACKLIAVEGFEPAVRELRKTGVYDAVEHELLQGWLARSREHYDLAVFGDVIEHLAPRQIHRVLSLSLERFRHVLVIVPLHHNMQDAIGGNDLEIHRSYLTSRAFDRYHPIEKHIVTGGFMKGMNVLIDTTAARVPFLRRMPQRLFHALMVLTQPIGLARPIACFLRWHANRWKWLIRC